MTPFCKKSQNSCLLISHATRTHNTWSSQMTLFFEISKIFLYFWKTKKSITRRGACSKKAELAACCRHNANFVASPSRPLGPRVRVCVDNILVPTVAVGTGCPYADSWLCSLPCSAHVPMSPGKSRRHNPRTSAL
jgi:hypothetical protein